MGISKQAFYKHFDSKDDLAIEAIRVRDDREGAAFQRQVQERGGGDPIKTMLAMFDVLDEWFNHPDFKGCLFLNACAEFPAPHDPIHQIASRHYSESEPRIALLAMAAGVDDPKALARELLLLCEGAVTSRLVSSDDNAAKTARRLAELAIERRRLPASSQRPAALGQATGAW